MTYEEDQPPSASRLPPGVTRAVWESQVDAKLTRLAECVERLCTDLKTFVDLDRNNEREQGAREHAAALERQRIESRVNILDQSHLEMNKRVSDLEIYKINFEKQEQKLDTVLMATDKATTRVWTVAIALITTILIASASVIFELAVKYGVKL